MNATEQNEESQYLSLLSSHFIFYEKRGINGSKPKIKRLQIPPNSED